MIGSSKHNLAMAMEKGFLFYIKLVVTLGSVLAILGLLQKIEGQFD